MHSLDPSRSAGQSGDSLNKIKLQYRIQFCLALMLWPTMLRWPILAEATAATPTYLLGYLAPNPGSIFPVSLATEWRSAFQVALEVLNTNRSYNLVAHMKDSDCTYLQGKSEAEEMLKQAGLLGAVGPACSQTAIAAAPIFDLNGPAALVSFAATAEPLSSRAFFPTFFRTVYSDMHQANAVAISMAKLGVTNATMLYTNDYYSQSLAQNINQGTDPCPDFHLLGHEMVGGIRMILLEPGLYNYTINRDQLKNVLNSLEPSAFVIIAVEPIVAEDFWTSAFEMGKVGYPWWYFGTDGVTAFDPNDADPHLVNALKGEIGLAPYGGDSSPNSRCSQFYRYWQENAERYPGLPALGVNKSRSYVPYLFDAVIAFYEILDGLLAAEMEFSSANVFMAFNESGSDRVSFRGCTGLVEFDPETGSRSVTAQPPIYDLVSLMATSWELKGRIENSTFVSLKPLERPGSDPVPGQEYYALNPKKKISAGLIAGIVFLVIAIIVLMAACFVYFAKKKRNPVFVRIT